MKWRRISTNWSHEFLNVFSSFLSVSFRKSEEEKKRKKNSKRLKYSVFNTHYSTHTQ